MTPERPITWSDEELRKASLVAWPWYANPSASFLAELHVFLGTLGAVHPAEVREREREAYVKGWKDREGLTELRYRPFDRCDERYPSLTPPSPPPLVLSDRHAWTRGATGWGWDEGSSGASHYESPPCRTASDAEKLAAWLRAYGSTGEAK